MTTMDVDGFGLRWVTETTTGRRGILDLRKVGRIVFSPENGEAPTEFVWRKSNVVGADLLKFVASDGDVRCYREERK